jgi:predicted ATPase/class 3 adenylate cyclase
VARPELPSGTVTFLFTDVEGSTRLLQEHGAGYADLLAEHRRALRDAFAQNSGVEVDTQGDAFFVAFSRATDAVAAAGEARQALEGGPIRVRMGLHTGEPITTDEGYVGMDVHRAARIAAATHGGQIVLSETTRRLLESDASIRDLGEHRLKDLVHAERLYQLGDGDFPPLRTLDATNLPIASSPLVGREREVEELVAMLSNGTRLLTLTGPGGTGKTRLALQVAAELVGTQRDGVFWVPLVGLSDPELLDSEVAQTIGAPDDLSGFLRGRQLLLLLDNFEHLLDAAPAVSTVLGASTGVRLLVTSRAPLRVAGEQEYRLEPLPASDAVTLFVERARAVGRELQPDPTVEAICRRLDGLPLAVELAAARTKLLAPDRLLERLDSALPILTGGARDAPERQRTLRATIEWSYDLLEPDSRELFARLSVFAGSFPLEAAEEVCSADLDGLAALVDYSLVKPIGDDRFLILDTIAEYARERLDELGAQDLRSGHADYFAAVAEDAYAHRFDAEAEWSARLETDQDDLRAALDWLEQNDSERALELAGALGWFWLSRGLLEEGCRRLSEALSASDDDGRSRARALTAAGSLNARHGDVERGREQLEEALRRWRELGDRDELASALDSLAWPLIYDAGDESAALASFEEALAIRRELGDSAGETRALVGVAQVLVALGEVERAETISYELLERAAGGDLRTEHFAYHFLADCALVRGDTVEAEERYRQSLRAALPLGDVIETSFEVQGVAMAVAGNGDSEKALRLAAAVEATWESLGISISIVFWDSLLDRYLSPARELLGAKADAVWAEGRALDFDDAVELALFETS